MRTAVIYTGHLRSFDRCVKTHRWSVFRHFHDLAFFVSTVDDQDAGKIECLRKLYPDSQIEFEAVKEQPTLPVPDGQFIPMSNRMFGHEPYAISVEPQAVARQLWQLERGYALMTKAIGDKELPEIVIRIRPDLWFHSFQAGGLPFGNRDCYSAWWGRFGGLNDRFAVMGDFAAEYYFQTWTNTPILLDRGCPFHPESLVRASLELGNCNIFDWLQTEFSTLRSDGKFRPPEIWPMDVAHCALNA